MPDPATLIAPGRRRFAGIGGLVLESGAVLPDVRIAYETWGTAVLDEGGDVTNAVLVEHALTGDSHAAGRVEDGHPTPGWWNDLVGPGRTFDTDRWFVVCPNVLGGCRGSTGPASPAPDGRRFGSRWPDVTIRDQVAAEQRLAEELRIRRWVAVGGGSMGGMRALEWAVTSPAAVDTLLLVATTAAASADQIATQSTQQLAIRSDPAWAAGDYEGAGPVDGLGLARRIAHLTYRSSRELDERFDGPGVRAYLDHHAAKLVARFDAGSYVALTEAMNGHDVGRDRGGVAAALRRVTARTVVVGIDSDRLYPLRQQEELAALIPGAEPLVVVGSEHGHDGFLVDTDQVAAAFCPLLT